MINSEFEDPNNHVPEVAPNDDWGDVEPIQDSQLPPRRTDPQKSLKSEMVISGYKSIDPQRPAESMSRMGFGQLRTVETEAADSESSLEKNPGAFQSKAGQPPPEVGSFAGRNRMVPSENKDWANPSTKISIKWMAGVSITIIGLIVAAIFFTQFSRRDGVEKVSQSKVEKTEVPAISEPVDEVLLRLNSEAQAAKDIYTSYAKADRIEDFIDRIYFRESNRADVNRVWTAPGAPEDWKPSENSVWEIKSNGKNPYGLLSGLNHDFSKFNAIFRYEGSELKLDWKASVGYGSADFADLKIGKGDATEIRAWISISNFYTNTLPENRYRSFLITSPKKDVSIWGYTEIGSKTDQQILSMFMISPITGEYKTEAMVTLGLERGEQEILPRQWMISKLVSMNWLDQNTP